MGLKDKYRNWKLKKQIGSVKRMPIVRNLDEIQKVGVIWQPSQKEAYRYIKDYFNKNQIIFRSFCVFDSNTNPPEGTNVLTPADLNFWGIPKHEKVADFMFSGYQLLLNISTEPSFVNNYITALTVADFKVGGPANNSEFFDLNINISQNQDALYLAKQQIFYLAQLNKNSKK